MLKKFNATVPTTESETNQNINLFAQIFHVSSFKSDENKLKSIIQHHVKPLDHIILLTIACLLHLQPL